jgi:hypothetical protein
MPAMLTSLLATQILTPCRSLYFLLLLLLVLLLLKYHSGHCLMVSTLALCSESSAFDTYIAANYQAALSSIFVYELFFLSNSLCCSLVFVGMLQLAKSFGVRLGHI